MEHKDEDAASTREAPQAPGTGEALVVSDQPAPALDVEPEGPDQIEVLFATDDELNQQLLVEMGAMEDENFMVVIDKPFAFILMAELQRCIVWHGQHGRDEMAMLLRQFAENLARLLGGGPACKELIRRGWPENRRAE